jgi:hypothetical protein
MTPRASPGTPWHPHRGFETVTSMLHGIFQHQDSNGGSELISDGDIQSMTAVSSSSESLTGDLEAYDDDAGVPRSTTPGRYPP